MDVEAAAQRDIDHFQKVMQEHLARLAETHLGSPRRVLLKSIWTEPQRKSIRRGIYSKPGERKFGRLSPDRFDEIVSKLGLHDDELLLSAYQRYLAACDTFHSVKTQGRLRSSLNPGQAEKRFDDLLHEEAVTRKDLLCFLTFLSFAVKCIEYRRDRGSVLEAWTNGLAIHYAFRRDQGQFPAGIARTQYLTVLNELNGQTAFMAGDNVAIKRIISEQKRVVEENPSWRARYVLVALEHDLAVSSLPSDDTPAILSASLLEEIDHSALEADIVDLESRISFELARLKTPLDARIPLFNGERFYSVILRCRQNAKRIQESTVLYRCYHALSLAAQYDCDVAKSFAARRRMLRLRMRWEESPLHSRVILKNLMDMGALSIPEFAVTAQQAKQAFERRKIRLPLVHATMNEQADTRGPGLSTRGYREIEAATRAVELVIFFGCRNLVRRMIVSGALGSLSPLIELIVNPKARDNRAPEVFLSYYSLVSSIVNSQQPALLLTRELLRGTAKQTRSKEATFEVLPIDDELETLRKENREDPDIVRRVASVWCYSLIRTVRYGDRACKKLVLKPLALQTGPHSPAQASRSHRR